MIFTGTEHIISYKNFPLKWKTGECLRCVVMKQTEHRVDLRQEPGRLFGPRRRATCSETLRLPQQPSLKATQETGRVLKIYLFRLPDTEASADHQ